MPEIKYNWEQLRGEYIRGDIETVAEFLRTKGIDVNTHGSAASKTAGWPKEREEFQKRLQEAADEKTIDTFSESEAQIRARQARTARYLQVTALRAMRENNYIPKDAKEATKMIEVGLVQERDAFGMNRQAPVIVGNFNVAVMNTHFGKMLQRLSYDELKTVLDELGRIESGGEVVVQTTDSIPDVVSEGEVVQD